MFVLRFMPCGAAVDYCGFAFVAPSIDDTVVNERDLRTNLIVATANSRLSVTQRGKSRSFLHYLDLGIRQSECPTASMNIISNS